MKIISICFVLSVCLLEYAFAKPAPEDENNSLDQDLSLGLKIFGGVEDPDNLFPYVVELETFLKNDDSKECSGTLLTDRTIITASSCVNYKDSTVLYVKATVKGNEYSFSPEEILKPLNYQYPVHSKCVHINYYYNCSVPDDVVILRLAMKRSPMKGLSSMELPKLPNSGLHTALQASVDAIVGGYGDQKSNQNPMRTTGFNYALVTTLTAASCQTQVNNEPNKYPSLIDAEFWKGTRICSSNFDIGICHKDQGGPLLVKHEGKIYIAGVNLPTFNICDMPPRKSKLPMIHSNLYPISDTLKKIVNYRV